MFSIATMAQTKKSSKQTPVVVAPTTTPEPTIDSLSVKFSIKDIDDLFLGFQVATTNLPKSKAPSDEMVASLTSFQHIKELIVAQYNLLLKKTPAKQ